MTTPITIPPTSLTTLTNKTILITGGSSGIGLATAHLLLSLSPQNNISILDLHPPPPSSPLTSPPNTHRTHYHKCNVTSWPSQRAGFAATISRFGRIDAVFVNAGISEYGEQFFADDLEGGEKVRGVLKEPDRRVVDVDLQAAGDTVKLAIYWMRKTLRRERDKNGSGSGSGGESRVGSIVMTASLAGYLASVGGPGYSAAKHGIIGLMRALKHDTAPLNIAISIVAPGITITPLLASTTTTPEQSAAEVSKRGVPVNKAETVALAVAYLMDLGMKGNGMGLLVQGDKTVDVEAGLARTRELWMGREMVEMFRGGRGVRVFENKL